MHAWHEQSHMRADVASTEKEPHYSGVSNKRACMFIIFKPFCHPECLLDPARLLFLRKKFKLHYHVCIMILQNFRKCLFDALNQLKSP